MKTQHQSISSATLAVLAGLTLATGRIQAAVPGDVDLSFDPGTGPEGNGSATAIDFLTTQPDGKVFIGGNFTSVDGVRRTGVARLNTDGSLDPAFTPTNLVFGGFSGSIVSIALQADGELLAAGTFPNPIASPRPFFDRLRVDGSLDTAFAPMVFGPLDALAIQPDGRILAGGTFSASPYYLTADVIRYNTNGVVDASFKAVVSGGNVRAMALQADGKVVIGGSFQRVQGSNQFAIARLDANGNLDANFNPVLRTDSVLCLAIDTNGEIYAGGGLINPTNVFDRFGLVRINPDGSFDTAFNQNVHQLDTAAENTRQSATVTAISIQSDGKILVNGVPVYTNGVFHWPVVRLNQDGTLDTNFDIGSGMNGAINSIAVDAESHVFIGGAFTNVSGLARNRIVRLVGGDAPVITSQPQSQFVNQGETVTFSVTAMGNPTPEYQWSKDGLPLDDVTNSTLILTNVQTSDEGMYAVMVSNRLNAVTSSNATLRVNLPPVADASATQLLYISPNGVDAGVVLDGSRSYDPDGDLLSYSWFENAGTVPLATGVAASLVLPVGQHPLLLVVNDGMAASTNAFTVEVITTAEAVEELMILTTAEIQRSTPLNSTLDAALASINRGNSIPAINQLQAFQNKIRAQVTPTNPALGETLTAMAQGIINALNAAPH